MSKPWYPLEAVNGSLRMATDYPDKVAQAILSAVLTYQEERIWRPGYGIATRPFDSLQVPEILAEVRKAIALGLEGYSGVTFRISGAPQDGGELALRITYQVPDQDPRTLEVNL